ncbi:MAG: hypothetical protein EZS28_055279, partial [Streblomastix strix]
MQNLRQRDHLAPTGEDKMNKELLPEIMRKRRFGLKSNTKYTHLTQEDTTYAG